MEIKMVIPNDQSIAHSEETANQLVGNVLKLRSGRESWPAEIIEATVLHSRGGLELVLSISDDSFEIVHNVFDSFS